MARGEAVPLERYFAGRDPRSRELFDAVRKAVESLGDAEQIDDEVRAWLREALERAR